MDLSGQFGYSPQFSPTHSKSLKVELLTLPVSDHSQLHQSTSTILLCYRVASGEPAYIRRTFLRRVPSESLVASGASGRHGPLSTSIQYKTTHPEREFTFYAPRPPDAQGAWGASGCNLFSLLMQSSLVRILLSLILPWGPVF